MAASSADSMSMAIEDMPEWSSGRSEREMKDVQQMNLSIQKDVPISGLENTSMRDAWFIEYRPTIRSIITSGNKDIFLCACTLCVPWMDGCYSIAHFGYDTVRHNPTSLLGKYSAKDVVKFIFFNNEEDNPSKEDLKLLSTFYNSLKHGGFLRPGQNVWRLGILLANSSVIEETKTGKTITLQQWVDRAVNRIDQLLIDSNID